ncbi:MAG: phosphoribosyltransferase [Chitinophagales bacterium]|nr:phosphoribosyltransferase [Chitinophagales bacterium]
MAQIANREKIERILERIAYQLAENYCHRKHITFVGVKESGYVLAQEVESYLKPILNLPTEVVALEIDKKNPQTSDIKLSKNIQVKETAIILVDDVINSGKTLFYALKPFFDMKIDALHTLILVERKHKRFPIVADHVGISLNTTMLEKIEVKVKGNKISSIELV